MKKAKMATSNSIRKAMAIAYCLLMCALICMGCDSSNNDSSDDDNGGKSYGQSVNSIDYTAAHVEKKLNSSIYVDADLPSEKTYSSEIPRYRILPKNPKYVDNKAYRENISEQLKKFYGDENLLLDSDRLLISDDVVAYTKKDCPLSWLYVEMIYNEYPFIKKDYNKDLIDPVVTKFINDFSTVVPFDMNNNYRVITVDDEFYQSIDDLYKRAGETPLGTTWVNNQDYTRKTFYFVSIKLNPGNGVYVQNCSYYPDCLRLDSSVLLVIDEQGELLGMEITDNYQIVSSDETKVKLCNLKELLYKFKEEVKDIDKKITITNLSVVYIGRISYEFETNIVKTYIEPEWRIQYYIEDECQYSVMLIDKDGFAISSR